MLKWNNTNEKEYPVHGQLVIVDIGNIYYIAVYNYKTKHFVATTEPFNSFSSEDYNIRWTEFKE